ncbi:uncharacterized protein LOC129946909 [Eupeodes corollae]|uniref:uncharacterized protein LOC129946909 n=1 Tax=Eupeodes corollae TaxID=290404 RepID=UPI002493C790|nr:uncharacterized protein LOC129946909 [Eupeodes corollae]
MIIKNQMNSPQTHGIMDSQQCESFYLKRKLGPDDQIDNGNGFVQAKKRHLQEYSPTQHNDFQALGESSHQSQQQVQPQSQQQQQQQQLDQHHQEQHQICNDMNFALSSSNYINDLFSYENNLVPVQTNFTNDQFDGNWQNSDLLELDHRYNSGLVITNEASQIHHQQQQDAANNNLQMPQTVDGGVGGGGVGDGGSNQQQNLTVFTMQKHSNSNIGGDFNPPHHPRPSNVESNRTAGTGKFNSETESDFEDKNLSWLFNFKLDELPHLSPEVNQIQPPPVVVKNNNLENSTKSQTKIQTKTGKKFEELVLEVTSELDANDMIVGENVIVENTPRMPKKPPFTYTELIEYALEDKSELTVSGIYQWISDRFPFYKSNDDRWKNSVRHNLSINPHFRKGVKAPQGAGHLWTISSGDSEENILAWEHKKQRLDLFFKMESLQRERNESTSSSRDQSQPMYDEAAIAAATITQEMLSSISPDHTISSAAEQSSTSCSPSSSTCDRLGTTSSVVSSVHELPFNDLITDEDLRKTAGQILNGIHRDVEVQAVNSIISTYHDSYLDTEDYLNPIQKDVSVHESSSGLRSEFYVTEIDPMELGIQVEEEVLFNDDFNLNYFGYNAGNDIVA